MRNIKLTIEYDGTNYAGWQVQARVQKTEHRVQKKTIQETIEKTLRKILQKRIKIIGSGRTDAGVHAQAQVANFKTASKITLEKLKRALNGNLPEDIKIIKIEEVTLDFHSRFYAKSKLYRYTILNRTHPSAFLRNTTYFYPHPLDSKLMQEEARPLLGRHNFSAFQACGSSVKDSVRTIKKVQIKKEGDLIYVDIEADGFLYNMVRNIVGTLIEIGRGKLPEGSAKKILLARNRKFAGPTLPAKGLCLLEVKYK